MLSSKIALVFKFRSSLTSLLRHNRCSLERPCNFVVFQGRKAKFDKLGYFDVFSSKMALVFNFKACMTSL